MSKLSIFFIEKEPFYYNDFLCKEGYIIIGDFKEKFYSSIEYWKPSDYEKQWQEAIERLKNYSQSCLITEINDPKKGHFVEWWTIYKRDEKLYLQNQFLFNKIYKRFVGVKTINHSNCFDFIPSFNIKQLKKSKASTWVIEVPKEIENPQANYQKGTLRIKKHHFKWAL
jgi:hypothetical protein